MNESSFTCRELAGPCRAVPLALACIALTYYACGGDGGTEPSRPPPDPRRPATVTVSPAASELTALGATAQLSADVRDRNGQALVAVVAWSSSDTSTATVNASGLVTAAGNGAAAITAIAGTVSGSAMVTVAQQVRAVEITPETGIVLPGTTLQLAAEARDANNHAVSASEFVWASSDPAVATVDETGLVTGIAPGGVEVSATTSGVTGRTELDVVEPAPAAVVVTPGTAVIEALGDTLRLTAEVQDQIGRPVPGEAVMWATGDPRVATVDSTGKLTAVGNGAAAVTATSGTISGEAAVRVMQVARRLALTAPADTLVLGDSLRLVAEAFDANGHPVAGAPLEWSSGNPSVARVDASGIVRGVGEGTVEIAVATGSIREAARVSVFSPDRAPLVALYEATNGDGWTDRASWASDRPLSQWFGVTVNADRRVTRLLLLGNGLEGRLPPEIGSLSRVEGLFLTGNRLAGRIPPELSGLSGLKTLWLSSNRFTGPIPPELGDLSGLRDLALNDNDLTGSIPAELGGLSSLEELRLDQNDLTGTIPSALGALSSLRRLWLGDNDLTGSIPSELGALSSLESLQLNENDLTDPIPPELGDLSSLRDLALYDNGLTGSIPAELGALSSLEVLRLDQNDLTGPIPGALGGMTGLRLLSLSNNALAGPLPAELSGLVQLRELRLNANPELSGFLPAGLRNLGNLTTLLAEGTSLCAPSDADFLAWLGTIENHRVARCRNDVPSAYLVQAVQSLDFPVPLIAGRPALLRVFLTAPDGESVDFPPVRARFHLGGEEVHTVDIPSPGGGVPAEVGEGSLDASANARIPADVLRPGLELVVEIDPDGTLGGEVGIAKRIPESGRQAIDVRTVPPLHLTYLPVLRPGREEPGFLERIAEFTADDPMFRQMRFWLPVAGLTLDVRETFLTSAATGAELLNEVEAIRVLEGGTGYYMGGLPSYLAGELRIGGLANRPGRSSLAQLESTTLAHELGHNLILAHAPCGGANLTDPDFPDRDGRVGAWGFDPYGHALVSPEAADVMGYCFPRWIGTFSFGKALDHRLRETAAAVTAESRGRTLLVWGGVDAAGIPFLDPAFVVNAPPTLPRLAGPYTLTGRTADGEALFSTAFDMMEVMDGDGGSGFVFALPVSAAWADRLSAIELSAPAGVATLDRTSSSPTALLRDPGTGRVRGILRDLASRGDHLGTLAGVAADPGAIASALPAAAGLEILISFGLPASNHWKR